MEEGLLFGEVAFSGQEDPQKILELQKALAVGYDMGTTDQVGFGATRIESLEKTLKWVTATEKSSRFWMAMKKSKGESTVEEFTVMNEIGDAGFYVEGGLPEEYDEDIKREFEQTKYIGAVGKVPNPAKVVKSIAEPIALITRAKAVAIIRHADVKMFWGDASISSLEWNGFNKQFNTRVKNPTQNIIDLEGKRLRPEVLNEVGFVIQDNYGDPNNIAGWVAPQAYRGYTDELLDARRFYVGSSEARDIVARAKKFELSDAAGHFESDLFLRHKGETYLDRRHPKLSVAGTSFAATTAKPPTTLEAGTCSLAISSPGTATKIVAGIYDYAVVPANKYGAGAAFEITSQTYTIGQLGTFTISDNGSPAGQEATSFEIYRKLTSSSGKDQYLFLKRVAASAASILDDGTEIPGTTYAFFWDWDLDQVLDFKQLLPMIKMPLAIIDDSTRWLQKLYGTPILYAPDKMVVVKNIGATKWA